MNESERRRHARTPGQESFLFRNPEAPRGDLLSQGELVDYSAGGVRFIARERLRKQAEIVVRLGFASASETQQWRRLWSVEGEGEVDLLGVVMWCLQREDNPGCYEVGLRFTGLAADQRLS